MRWFPLKDLPGEPHYARPAHAVLLCDVRQRHSREAVTGEGLVVDGERCPPQALAFQPAPPHARPDALRNQGPLELRHGPDYLEHQPPGGRA